MIESTQNKLVKKLTGLKQRKYREQEGLFIAEGLRFVEEIPTDWQVEFYVAAEDFDISQIKKIQHAPSVPVHVFSKNIFKTVSSTENPQGILAVCHQKKPNLELCMEKKPEFFLLAEEMNDPGNLGTIIRTADACGVNGIFLSSGSVDLYNPKVLRSTMGSLFHVPVFQDVALPDIIVQLQQRNIKVYAAHLSGKQYLYDLNLKTPCAILIGNEARGLTDKSAALCDALIKIPMPGQAESLNASIAAGVVLYETVRQRISS